MGLIKFILGWIMWVIILILSLIFSLITWNWKEILPLNTKPIIIEMFGKSTWEVMTGDYSDDV